MTTIQKLTTLLALASLAAITAGCVKTAVRKDAAAAADTVQAASATPDIITGTFTDPRDGKAYRTVRIGEQTWMAENLNFKTDSSRCYEDKARNCNKYGRLYYWDEAVNACPAGWRVPNEQDVGRLAAAAGGTAEKLEYGGVIWKFAAVKLKSTTGWREKDMDKDGNPVSGNGTDDIGFSARPGGTGFTADYGFHSEGAGFDGVWWNAMASDASKGRCWAMFHNNADVVWSIGREDLLFSLRCVEGAVAVRRDAAAARTVQTVDTVPAAMRAADNGDGTFTDQRDGRRYRTVKIGKAAWMAENLNFKTDSSRCYNDIDSNCQKYGRLYNWDDAMKACPAPWRLPGDKDWDSLAMAVAGGHRKRNGEWNLAAKKLKTKTGWVDYRRKESNCGTDDFGFSALPGGCRNVLDKFDNAGSYGYWWSAAEDDAYFAYDRNMAATSDYLSRDIEPKTNLRSVRCLNDSPP